MPGVAVLCCVTFFLAFSSCIRHRLFSMSTFLQGSPLTFMYIEFHYYAITASSIGCAKPEAHTESLGVCLDLWSTWHLPHPEIGLSNQVPKNVW